MRLINIMWFGLVLVVAVAIFVLKYEVQNLEDDLAARHQEIEDHKQAIHVLKAEWTFLNDPTRLKRLGAEHLELAPADPSRIVAIDAVPKKRPPLSQTPAPLVIPGGPQ